MKWLWWFAAIAISLNLGLSLRLWRSPPLLPPHSRVRVHQEMPYVNTQPLPLVAIGGTTDQAPPPTLLPLPPPPSPRRPGVAVDHVEPELKASEAAFEAGVVQPLPEEPGARGARVTLFTLPRSMLGEAGLRQRIAIMSWLQLRPRPYILLMGDDPGVGEYAREIGVTWVPDIAKNEYGTPLLSSCWERAHQLAPTRTRVFINTDIVLFDGFTEAVAACELHYKEDFFMSGQRTTVRVRPEDVPLERPDWLAWLYAKSSDKELATPDTLDAVDYFAFTSGLLRDIPPFAIGRYSWDSWILHHLVVTLADTVDASEVVRIAHLAHQVHDKMTSRGNSNVLDNPEVQENRRLAGGSTHMGNLQHSWDVLAPCDAATDDSCHGFSFKPKQRRWRSPGNKKFVFINNTTITDRNEAIEAVRREREKYFRAQELKKKPTATTKN